MTKTFGDVVRNMPSNTFPFLTVTCTTHPCKKTNTHPLSMFKIHNPPHTWNITLNLETTSAGTWNKKLYCKLNWSNRLDVKFPPLFLSKSSQSNHLLTNMLLITVIIQSS